MDPERDQRPLAELRPGLPARLVEQTESLLGRSRADESGYLNVRSFIASIAMADELKRGEEEYARVIQELTDEQRQTREELAAERKAHEEDLARQAEKFRAERESILRDLTREREDRARELARERAEAERQLRSERERMHRELARERTNLDRERANLEKERSKLDRDRARLEGELARLERDRAAFEHGAAATPAQGASVRAARPHPLRARAAGWWDRVRRAGSGRRLGLTVALLTVVIAVAAFAFTRGRSRDGPTPVTSGNGAAAGDYLVVDSLGGVTMPAPGDERGANTNPVVAPIQEPERAIVRDFESRALPQSPPAVVRPDLAAAENPVAAPVVPPRPVSSQPALRVDSVVRGDSMPPRDSMRRDTLPPRDTLLRRDTLIRRDTLARRDTSATPDSVMPTGPRRASAAGEPSGRSWRADLRKSVEGGRLRLRPVPLGPVLAWLGRPLAVRQNLRVEGQDSRPQRSHRVAALAMEGGVALSVAGYLHPPPHGVWSGA
jgi:hypothetical protein